MISYDKERIESFFRKCDEQYRETSGAVQSMLPNLQVFAGMIGPERAFLLQNLLKAVNTRSADLLVVEDESMQKIAVVRFLFESLILARLVMKEDEFAKKSYYSSFAQHYEKKKAIVEQIEKEIGLLKTYIEREEVLTQEFRSNLDNKPAEEVITENQEKDQQMLADLLNELTAFTDDAAELGFSYHLQNLEEMYKSYLSDKAQLRPKIIDALTKLGGHVDDNASDDQLARALTKLTKDERKWDKRAADAGLAADYNFIYRYSSGLLHGGTYAFFTPHDLSPEENVMLTRVGLKYFNAIVESIRSATPIFNIRVMRVQD